LHLVTRLDQHRFDRRERISVREQEEVSFHV
jgi:hypothetical protein